MDRLPATFDHSSPDHHAWLLLSLAGVVWARPVDVLRVAAGLGFTVVEWPGLGTDARHDLGAMRICTRQVTEVERRLLVGRELARVALKIAGGACAVDALSVRRALLSPEPSRWPREPHRSAIDQ